MLTQTVIDIAQFVHLAGFSASIGAVLLVLTRRAREEWWKRERERKIAAAAEPDAPYHNAPVTSPMGLRDSRPTPQRVQAQKAGWRLWPCCWIKRSRKGEEHAGSFLKWAGLVHLVLDLVVSAVRISYICLELEIRFLNYRRLRRHEYVAGLAVETCFLQAVWLLYTHFRIVACVRRREIKVTGKLFRPLCFSALVWLSVGLGPVIFAHYLGISQAQVQGPVSTAGSLVGFVLLLYLLFAYRGALRAFQHVTNEAARRVRDAEGGQGSHGSNGASGAKTTVCCRTDVLRRLLCMCITATDDFLQEVFPDLAEDSEEDSPNVSDRSGSSRHSLKASSSKGSKGSSGGGLLGDDQPPHISQVEQRLRQTLRRVLKVYVATFMCVICAGLVAGDKTLVESTSGQVLLMLFDVPYTLMGVTDAVMVGGLGKKQRLFSKDARKEIMRRKMREKGQLAAEEQQEEGRYARSPKRAGEGSPTARAAVLSA